MDEQLKELLEKASENLAKVKQENIDLGVKLTDLMSKYDDLVEKSKKGEDQSEKIEDIRLKMENIIEKSRSNSERQYLTDEEKQVMYEKALKPVVGAWFKSGEKSLVDFKVGESVAEHLKTLNITNPEQGGLAVAEIFSRDVIQYAREFSPVMQLVGRNALLSRNYRQLVLQSYPSVRKGIENVAGVALPETTTPTFAEVRSKEFKVEASPRLTDEAKSGADIDLYSMLISLVATEITVYLSYQLWYGDGSDKSARGILSSGRVDMTESLKPTLDPDTTKMRDADFYPVMKSGVAGALGSDRDSSIDFLIDVTDAIPTAYLPGARWIMNRKTRNLIKKLRDSDGNPIFIESYKSGGEAEILGFPITIDDTLPDPVSGATPIIFGQLNQAYYINEGDVNKMLINPYRVEGCTILEYSKEMFEMVGKTDAIIIASLSA